MTAAPGARLEVSEGVGQVILNRPDHGNALDLATAKDLERALVRAEQSTEVRVLLLCGAGRHFCTGGDLLAVGRATDPAAHVLELARAAHDAVRVLMRLEKPVVARLRGSAAGAGLSLLLLADVVYAEPGANLLTAYTRVGLSPDCGQSWLLPRAVGMARSLRMTVDPRPVTAAEAHEWGIVSELVAHDLLDQFALDRARRLARGPATALGRSRALIRQSMQQGLSDHLDREAEAISELSATPEAQGLIAELVGPSGQGGSRPDR